MQVRDGFPGNREPASDHRSAYLGLLHFVDSHGVVEQALALGRGQAWGMAPVLGATAQSKLLVSAWPSSWAITWRTLSLLPHE